MERDGHAMFVFLLISFSSNGVRIKFKQVEIFKKDFYQLPIKFSLGKTTS